MARFFHGLNIKIQDIVELHDYTSLSTLVHHATKVELQLKRHGRRSYPNTSSSWKGKERRKTSQDRTKSLRVLPHKVKKKRYRTHNFSMPKQKDNDLKGEWRKSTSSESESSSEEAHYDKDLLMVRRFMSIIIGDDQSQREYISFKVLDSWKIVNVVSLGLVEKLSIPTLPHPKPYKFNG
ncbi:hypothetical protein CR513_46508, partial [Mucuna pruriens]